MLMIIYLFVMFTVSSASDLAIYVYNEDGRRNNVDKKSTSLFQFEYHDADMLKMIIILVNEAQHVNTAVYLITERDSFIEKKIKKSNNNPKMPKYCEINHSLNRELIIIQLEFSSKTGFCSHRIIVQGTRVHLKEKKNNTPFSDMCLTTKPCTVKVDLSNILCGNEDPANRKPPEHINATTIHNYAKNYDKNSKKQKSSNKLLYIILSVVGAGLIIMVIFFFIKKYWNSQPVESTELNNYATANEILYADLSLAQRDTVPTTREEESPYAQIIGVMRPDDGNFKKE